MASVSVFRRSVIHALLSLSILAQASYALALETDAEAAALLSTVDEGAYARRGSWFNREADEDWLARLLASSPKVERVFLRHDPLSDQWSDRDLLICFNRALQDVERGGLGEGHTDYRYDLTLTFADGTSATDNSNVSTWLITGREASVRGRCFRVGEHIVHPGGRWGDIRVEGDRKFRAGGIKSVAVRIQRKGKYEVVLVDDFSTTEIFPYTRSTRTLYKNGNSRGEVQLQPEFIEGRWKGEIFYLVQKCTSLRSPIVVSPPAETEVTEYAAGFEHGYKLGERFVQKHRRACDDSLKMFGHDGYERPGLLIAR